MEMTDHNQEQQQEQGQQAAQGDEQRAQETVQREGLDQLDGGQGWRPPAEGGTESTIETAKGGNQVEQDRDRGTLGTGIYDSGQGSRPSTEAGEFEEEEGLDEKEPWNG
jgi:hypothetical protein